MTWSEHWPIVEPIEDLDARTLAALVDAALLARDLVVGPTIVFDSGELEGAQIESFGRYLTIALGIGDLHGRIAISAPLPGVEGDAGFIEFSSDDVRGAWEPLYTLFAELALAVGAAQEEPFVAPLDPDELRDDVQAIVDACISEAMTAEGLDSGDAVIAAATAADPPASPAGFDLDVGFRAEAVGVRVTAAGEHFEVIVRGLVAGLSAAGRAAIVRALAEDLEPRIAFHRWIRHQRVAPDDDPERGGKLFLERRAGARLIDAAELTELAALRAAVAEHDVDVIRYFASGAPFWKVSYERGHEIDELVTSLEELHADRTWQWSAADDVATD